MGSILLGSCLPTTYCTIFGLKHMKEKRGLIIQQKINHGCRSDWTLDFKVIGQHLSHWSIRNRCWFQVHHYYILLNLQVTVDAVNNESHVLHSICNCEPLKQMFAKHASILYKPGSTKLSLFFSKKMPFPSHSIWWERERGRVSTWERMNKTKGKEKLRKDEKESKRYVISHIARNQQ
jgi:hypothetical protein